MNKLSGGQYRPKTTGKPPVVPKASPPLRVGDLHDLLGSTPDGRSKFYRHNGMVYRVTRHTVTFVGTEEAFTRKVRSRAILFTRTMEQQ